jgi:hypothetical protein
MNNQNQDTNTNYYNEDGEQIHSPQDQIALNRIRQKLYSAEARLDSAYNNNNYVLAQSIKSSIAFLERRERSFYR